MNAKKGLKLCLSNNSDSTSVNDLKWIWETTVEQHWNYYTANYASVTVASLEVVESIKSDKVAPAT